MNATPPSPDVQEEIAELKQAMGPGTLSHNSSRTPEEELHIWKQLARWKDECRRTAMGLVEPDVVIGE